VFLKGSILGSMGCQIDFLFTLMKSASRIFSKRSSGNLGSFIAYLFRKNRRTNISLYPSQKQFCTLSNLKVHYELNLAV
jgi:hypothetical protein